MNYGSLFLDLFVVFLLLNRRTRVIGFVGVLTFHFMNSRLFGIGIFPWVMIASTVVFFEPDWPRRVLQDLRQGHRWRRPALAVGFLVGFTIGGALPNDFSIIRALLGGVGVAIAAYHLDEPFRGSPVEISAEGLHAVNRDDGRYGIGEPLRIQTWGLSLLGLWVAVQVLVPLRHLAIPGNVHWTEEGHNFSWHMKLRDKESDGYFVVTDPTSGREWTVDPDDHLTSRQEEKMTSRPEMIVEFAHYLEELKRVEGYEDVGVRGRIFASLNGRDEQLLIDPEVDLTAVPYPWFGNADWILPLAVPLE